MGSLGVLALAVLCVGCSELNHIDVCERRPREMDVRELQSLRDIAALVERELMLPDAVTARRPPAAATAAG